MKIIIMSGIPGCGKGYYIRHNFADSNNVVCSADHFFETDGGYHFNPMKLGEAHSSCLKRFIDEMCGDSPLLVIVDNTAITALEMAPYVAIGAAYDIPVSLVTLICPPGIAFSRGKHGVPMRSLIRMSEELKRRQLPRFWDLASHRIGTWNDKDNQYEFTTG